MLQEQTTDSGEAARVAPPAYQFDFAVEAAAAGDATPDQLALLEADRPRWRRTLERLLAETEDNLVAVRSLSGPERAQVVADFEQERERLAAALELVVAGAGAAMVPAGEVRLQASWSAGRLVAWAGGPAVAPAHAEDGAARLRAAGAPAAGWLDNPPVKVPGGAAAPARSIAVGDALGWLVAIGAQGGDADAGEGMGASLRWLGRVAVWAVRLVAHGKIVPALQMTRRRGDDSGSGSDGQPGAPEWSVRWAPALVRRRELEAMASAMPPPVGALSRADATGVTLEVLTAMVDTITRDAASRMELPAPPPRPRTPADVAEAIGARLDGRPFEAPTGAGAQVAERLDRWARPVTRPSDSSAVVQLDPPDRDGAWHLSVLGPDADGRLVPIEVALLDGRSDQQLPAQLARLERLLPVLLRPGGRRRGEVVLSGDEAWDVMAHSGPTLEAAGFDVRVPALARRKPKPLLRLSAEPVAGTVVGAHQLADVRWSAVFGDVELTAADISRLAAEARPLIRSGTRWIELDHADLNEAAAALAERAGRTRMTGAEVLRHAIGLESSPLGGGFSVAGSGWAADLLAKAATARTEPVTRPEGFVGELRAYQAESLAWLEFLDSAELGGCLALDMGLGKTPTVLAHLANAGGKALVIAPPAVVGNWAAEAERFTPGLRVVIHHGAQRASADELEEELRDADVVITTYGTGVRDIEALSARTWDRVVLDEAQAIKNPASDTAQQLRRLDARSRLVLTGTPIENGLGDLWALLDFTNPGLVGPRGPFVSQLSSEGGGAGNAAERALRALNGLLVFRRTKAEPVVAAELPDRIDELDHCTMTSEQIGLYQAVLDGLVNAAGDGDKERQKGAILAAITALKQICNHPAAYNHDDRPLEGRSGKLARLEEIVDAVFEAGERMLIFTHFAEWGKRLADHLTERTGVPIACYHGGLARGPRDRLVEEFQEGTGAGALVLSLKAGGTGLNLTAASHVVLYDRWWNPAVEDQARDR
ncbi:MAG TPA: DEAD/DEAH box helicase, partial [Acidimicrobiales bacterium]|nr:DEAD/DEAH box helicase [Acidimicrobiales bacterium]